MKIRIWFIRHDLPASELEKLVHWAKHGQKNGKPRPEKVRYRKSRHVEDHEFGSIQEAFTWADSQRIPVKDAKLNSDGVLQSYVTVFAAAEAKDGVKCQEIEGKWHATEQLLFGPDEWEETMTTVKP